MKIWTDKESTKSHLGLTNEAAAVIGLLSMGYEDLDQIAGLLRGMASFKAKRRLAGLVAKSENPVILRCKVHPPADLSAELADSVRCPTCGHKVFCVPCRFCSSIGFSKVYTEVQVEEPSASAPTRHLPGTSGKLMVLAARCSLGEPLWHPEDGRWPWPMRGGRWRIMESLLTRCQSMAEDTWCVPEDESGPGVEDLLT